MQNRRSAAYLRCVLLPLRFVFISKMKFTFWPWTAVNAHDEFIVVAADKLFTILNYRCTSSNRLTNASLMNPLSHSANQQSIGGCQFIESFYQWLYCLSWFLCGCSNKSNSPLRFHKDYTFNRKHILMQFCMQRETENHCFTLKCNWIKLFNAPNELPVTFIRVVIGFRG